VPSGERLARERDRRLKKALICFRDCMRVFHDASARRDAARDKDNRPPVQTYRHPWSEVASRATQATSVARDLNRGSTGGLPFERALRDLEAHVRWLRNADDWRRRLSLRAQRLRRTLRAERGRAFERLVTNGCSPDTLLEWLEADALDEGDIDRPSLAASKRRRRENLQAVRALERRLRSVAAHCQDSRRLRSGEPGAYCVGDKVVAFLLSEADQISNYRQSYHVNPSRGQVLLARVSTDAKLATGKWQDEDLAILRSSIRATSTNGLRTARRKAIKKYQPFAAPSPYRRVTSRVQRNGR
jgi:hypothetical protein